MVETQIKGVGMAGMAAAVSNQWTAIKDLMEANGQAELAEKFTKKTGVVGRIPDYTRQHQFFSMLQQRN